MEEKTIVDTVKYWIEKTIIGFNFCPFARREFERNSIHYEVVDERNTREQLHAIVNEFHRMDNNPDIETTIVILPLGLESFFDYLDFLEVANSLLAEENYEGVYQLASFHPDYCFENVQHNDPSNYTNRSPFPLVHIIREASLEKALENYSDPEDIPENNIKLAREKGSDIFESVLKNSKKR